MHVSGFPIGMYYPHGVIHPTATELKSVQNKQCRTFFIYFIQGFFSYLFWFPDLSESLFILHDFARL